MNKYEKQVEDQIAQLASVAGKLPGVIVLHDIKDWSVAWMSPPGLKQLGVSLDEITSLSASEYFALFFNEEDAKEYAPKILGLLERNNDDEVITYFQQVRLGVNADWSWHMSSTSVFIRDEFKKPILTVTFSIPIDAMHHMTSKASKLLEDNIFLRDNFKQFSRLTRREREILQLLALGKSSAQTAKELFISLGTVDTHRKNIRKKLDISSYYELCQFARAFDLI